MSSEAFAFHDGNLGSLRTPWSSVSYPSWNLLGRHDPILTELTCPILASLYPGDPGLPSIRFFPDLWLLSLFLRVFSLSSLAGISRQVGTGAGHYCQTGSGIYYYSASLAEGQSLCLCWRRMKLQVQVPLLCLMLFIISPEVYSSSLRLVLSSPSVLLALQYLSFFWPLVPLALLVFSIGPLLGFPLGQLYNLY